MVEGTLYLEDWGTNDVDIEVPCECGNKVYLYLLDFVKQCGECGRMYVAKAKINVYLVERDYAVGFDTSDDNPEF